MNLWTRFLIAIGVVEKKIEHVLSPINKMTSELEDIAARERAKILDSKDAIAKHQETIQASTATKTDAESSAAAVRSLFLPKAA